MQPKIKLGSEYPDTQETIFACKMCKGHGQTEEFIICPSCKGEGILESWQNTGLKWTVIDLYLKCVATRDRLRAAIICNSPHTKVIERQYEYLYNELTMMDSQIARERGFTND